MEIVRLITHYGMHFVAPGLLAIVFFRSVWKKAWGIMILTMLVDFDHLLADPMFDPTRCSIGFHPLHSYWAIAVYVVLLFPKKTRIVATGLVFHMITDAVDCLWL